MRNTRRYTQEACCERAIEASEKAQREKVLAELDDLVLTRKGIASIVKCGSVAGDATRETSVGVFTIGKHASQGTEESVHECRRRRVIRSDREPRVHPSDTRKAAEVLREARDERRRGRATGNDQRACRIGPCAFRRSRDGSQEFGKFSEIDVVAARFDARAYDGRGIIIVGPDGVHQHVEVSKCSRERLVVVKIENQPAVAASRGGRTGEFGGVPRAQLEKASPERSAAPNEEDTH